MPEKENTAKTAFKNAKRQDTFWDDPELLTIVTDPAHELFDERALDPFEEGLVDSIMAIGQQQPIMVRKNGKDKNNGKEIVEVIIGRKRVKAIREINRRLALAGQPPIRAWWVNVSGSDEKELIAKVIAENEIRFPDKPSVKARKLHRLIQRGATEREASISFGISVAECKKLLKLMDLHTDAATAIDEGRLSLSAASKLIGLPRAEQKTLLESLVADGGRITADRIEEGKRIQPDVDGGIPPPKVKPPRVKTRREIEARIIAIQHHVVAKECSEEEAKVFISALKWVLGEAPKEE